MFLLQASYGSARSLLRFRAESLETLIQVLNLVQGLLLMLLKGALHLRVLTLFRHQGQHF